VPPGESIRSTIDQLVSREGQAVWLQPNLAAGVNSELACIPLVNGSLPHAAVVAMAPCGRLRDSDFDLLVGGADGDVAVFVNKGPPGKPRLTPAGTVRGTAFGNHLPAPQWPSAVDWDDDGDLDLVLSGLKLYRNTSSAACPDFDESALRVHTAPRASACVVDWDNDGDLDVLYVDQQKPHVVQILTNRGTSSQPTFGTEGQAVLVAGKSLETTTFKGQYVEPWGHTVKLCVVDWDGDGKKDLLIGGKDVRVHLNAGSDTAPVLRPAV